MKAAKSPGSQALSEYSVELAQILSHAAQSVASDYPVSFDQARAMTYLSLLSIELALKAFLERAGMPQKLIRKFNHDLISLVGEISGNCTVMRSVTPSARRRVRATSILSGTVEVKQRAPGHGENKVARSTIGKLLRSNHKSSLGNGISSYPTEIRYGSNLTHFPPFVVLELDRAVLAWVASNIELCQWSSADNPVHSKRSPPTP